MTVIYAQEAFLVSSPRGAIKNFQEVETMEAFLSEFLDLLLPGERFVKDKTKEFGVGRFCEWYSI